MGRFSGRLLETIAGIETQILDRPECAGEKRIYQEIGLNIAVTSAFAGVSGGYAMYICKNKHGKMDTRSRLSSDRILSKRIVVRPIFSNRRNHSVLARSNKSGAGNQGQLTPIHHARDRFFAILSGF